jgi:octaprenyl-diphosphate synthase
LRQRTALREYGKALGLCFQIKDDIFDYSDLEEIGKPTMSDLRDGKVTLPLIEALRRAPQEEAAHIKALGEKLVSMPETASKEEKESETRVLEEIKSFVLRFKGDEYAVQQMVSYKKQATEALSVFRDSPEKRSLLLLLDYAINRVQ